MGIRETLNENPRLTTGITIGMIVVVLGVIAWQIKSGSSGAPSMTGGAGKVFFTDDDGVSWFPDDAKKVPPFNHNGKEAVRAIVYNCDGKIFVNHLLRYPPDARKKVEDANAKAGAGGDPTALDAVADEAKVPGQKDWVKRGDPRYNEVIKPRCSNLDAAFPVQPK